MRMILADGTIFRPKRVGFDIRKPTIDSFRVRPGNDSFFHCCIIDI